MGELSIRPFEGFGPLDFNQTRDEIVKILGRPVSSAPTRLIYDNPGLIALFDDAGHCEHLGATVDGSHPGTVAVFLGVQLNGPVCPVVAALELVGCRLLEDENNGAYVSKEYGFSLWLNIPEDGAITTVDTWRSGYWDTKAEHG